MKVELIDYTEDGINKIARIARSTRMNKLEEEPEEIGEIKQIDDYGPYELVITDEYKEWEKKNENFVKTLLKVKHDGVMEHINFTFHIHEISRALTHQLVRHRIGFSYLQMSNRHAKPEMGEFVKPKTIDDEFKHILYNGIMDFCYTTYMQLLDYGVPVEDARYVLPPAFFTHISFTCNARSLRNFLKLRLDKTAQWEIRALAQELFDQAHRVYPALFADLKELRDK